MQISVISPNTPTYKLPEITRIKVPTKYKYDKIKLLKQVTKEYQI